MFEIKGRKVGYENEPYIIAELSANHGGLIENAIAAIKIAKKAGANAVKIQTYTPDTMTIESYKPDFKINEGLWKGNFLYNIYKEAYTPFEWHKELFDCAEKENITIFSSPFDETAVDLLESLNAPAYKIASFELVDLQLIKRAAKCKKPLLISTGMASLEEIGEALEVAKTYGSGDVLLFHCISSYPAAVHECNLSNIVELKNHFKVEVGLSDHTISDLAATVAIGLGASAIEKHFKPTHDASGPDASFSITPQQLKSLVRTCNDAWLSIGKGGFKRSATEEGSRKHRRSVYFVRDIQAGDKIKEADIRSIRPGFGLPPKYFNELIGKQVRQNVERGDPVSFKNVSIQE